MYTARIQQGYTIIAFDAKPLPDALAVIKQAGMRWNASDKTWAGKVDHDKVCKRLDQALGLPLKPDGACWQCKAPNGFFRHQGPFTPVYCDDCQNARIENALKLKGY